MDVCGATGGILRALVDEENTVSFCSYLTMDRVGQLRTSRPKECTDMVDVEEAKKTRTSRNERTALQPISYVTLTDSSPLVTSATNGSVSLLIRSIRLSEPHQSSPPAAHASSPCGNEPCPSAGIRTCTRCNESLELVHDCASCPCDA